MSNPQDEREAFEAAMKKVGFSGNDFQRSYHGQTYESYQVDNLWDGWQARAALANQRAEAGVPCLQCIGYVSRHYGQTILDLPSKDTQPVYVVAAQPEAVPQGGQSDDEAPTAEELEAFRRKHWSHWSASENLLIAHLVQQLRCAALPSPQPPAAQAFVPLTDEQVEAAWRLGFRAAIDAERLNADEEWSYKGANVIEAISGMGTAKPAQPEDENEVLRQKVRTLAREAWAWSKACEAESMKLTAVRKAIADAFLPMSRSGLWTKEHSQSYPSKAAEIINAARSIFDVEASQPAQPEAGITAPAGGGEVGNG